MTPLNVSIMSSDAIKITPKYTHAANNNNGKIICEKTAQKPGVTSVKIPRNLTTRETKLINPDRIIATAPIILKTLLLLIMCPFQNRFFYSFYYLIIPEQSLFLLYIVN